MSRRFRTSNKLTFSVPGRDYDGFRPMTEYVIPFDEAVSTIKKSTGRDIYVRAIQYAPSKNQESPEDGHRLVVELSTNVKTSKRVALAAMESLYNAPARITCLVRIVVGERSIFIG